MILGRSLALVVSTMFAAAALAGSLVPPPEACRARTLAPKERLRQPAMKAPVNPGWPLTWGRSETKLEIAVEGATLVITVPGAEGVVRAEAEKAVEIPLGGDVAHLAFFRGDTASGEPDWWVLNCDVLDGRVGPSSVTFHDGDGNGRFFDAFSDFVTEKGRLYPVAPTMIMSGSVLAATYDESARTVASEPVKDFVTEEIFPNWNDVVKGLAYINDVRGRMGLMPFGLDRDASHRAMLHANYCVRNGVFQHEEDPEKPGYTVDGMRAGMRSIGSQISGVTGSIREFLTTLLHRIPLVDPRLREIGIAANGQVWIETESGVKRPWKQQGPVVFPGPDGAWDDGAMAMERPDPRPPGVTAAVGLPVTVGFYGDEGPTKVRAALYLGKQAIECWRLDDEVEDLDRKHFDRIRAVLMPKKTLGHKTYRLDLEWRQGPKAMKLSRNVTIGN